MTGTRDRALSGCGCGCSRVLEAETAHGISSTAQCHERIDVFSAVQAGLLRISGSLSGPSCRALALGKTRFCACDAPFNLRLPGQRAKSVAMMRTPRPKCFRAAHAARVPRHSISRQRGASRGVRLAARATDGALPDTRKRTQDSHTPCYVLSAAWSGHDGRDVALACSHRKVPRADSAVPSFPLQRSRVLCMRRYRSRHTRPWPWACLAVPVCPSTSCADPEQWTRHHARST